MPITVTNGLAESVKLIAMKKKDPGMKFPGDFIIQKSKSTPGTCFALSPPNLLGPGESCNYNIVFKSKQKVSQPVGALVEINGKYKSKRRWCKQTSPTNPRKAAPTTVIVTGQTGGSDDAEATSP
jgi:hypothetical protein